MNFEFNPEDHIDTKFYRKFLDSTKYPNLTAKLKEDLHKAGKDGTYAGIINLYNGVNVNEIQLNPDGVLRTVDAMLGSISFNKVRSSI
jgi:hypothetical protein